jgi:hypothetical protein
MEQRRAIQEQDAWRASRAFQARYFDHEQAKERAAETPEVPEDDEDEMERSRR